MYKIISLYFILITVVNALSYSQLKGLNRYRKSFILNIAKNIKNDPCPLIDYFETRQKKADEMNIYSKKIKWNSISRPWEFNENDYDDYIYQQTMYNLLEQNGEVPLID